MISVEEQEIVEQQQQQQQEEEAVAEVVPEEEAGEAAYPAVEEEDPAGEWQNSEPAEGAVNVEDGVWVQCTSEDGDTYWYNCETEESQWEPPSWPQDLGEAQQVQDAPFDLSDPNARNSRGESALHLVSGLCFLGGMRLLVENGANVNCADHGGRRPLHAVCGGTGSDPVDACVELLLMSGADACAADTSGRTPLHVAVAAGRADVVTRLLRAGAPRGAVDCDGNTALHLAAVNGHLEVMQLLVLWKDAESSETAHQSSAGQGQGASTLSRPETYVSDLSESEGALMGEHFARTPTPSDGTRTRSPSPVPHAMVALPYGISAGSWTQCETENGDTYFYNLASGHSQWEPPQNNKWINYEEDTEGDVPPRPAEVEEGTSGEHSNAHGWQKVAGQWQGEEQQQQQYDQLQHHHQQQQHLKVWDKFFENAAKKNLSRRRGMKRPKNKSKEPTWPLLLSADVYASVIEAATCPTASAGSQAAALIAVAAAGDDACLEDLLIRGFPPSCRDEALRTPMHHACHYGATACVSLLWEYGAEVDARDERGNTPLMEASSSGHSGCLLFLLKSAAAIDAGNYRGDTALHAAVWNGQLDCVKALARYGCNLQPRNNISLTPHASVLALSPMRRNPPPQLQETLEYLEWQVRAAHSQKERLPPYNSVDATNVGNLLPHKSSSSSMTRDDDLRARHRRTRRRRRRSRDGGGNSSHSSSTSSYSLSLDDLDPPPSKHLPIPPDRRGLPPPAVPLPLNPRVTYTHGGWGAVKHQPHNEQADGGSSGGVWEAVGIVGRMIFGSHQQDHDIEGDGRDHDSGSTSSSDSDGRGGMNEAGIESPFT
jgi:ankyrin repeat protein